MNTTSAPIGFPFLGLPDEQASAILFLASDDAGFITGSTISANGGQFFV